MAKKKTSKKKTSKKKARVSSKKKASARKSTAASKGKSSKASSRKKASSGKTAAKKKTKTKTKRKTTKKKVAKKPVTKKKKKTSRKTTTKKKTVKKAAVEAKADTTDQKASSDTTKKSSGKKKSGQAKITRGKSVVEVATATIADAQGYVVINGRRVRMISTKGLSKLKKKTTGAATQEVDQVEKNTKPLKTKLSKKELTHYRKLLLIKRAETVGDLSAMEAEALRSSDGDLSNMPIHMADLGSDTYEQDFMLGMAKSERERLRDIDEALMRIQNRTYGICQMTNKPIPTARLEAKPWAKYTIEAARQLEGSWGA